MSVLALDEGENTIALSIVNNWNNDLSEVTVEVDRDKLPSWMSFRGTPQSVDVRIGAKGHEKLYMLLSITDAQADAEAQVPFTLIDALGNTWKYTTSFKVSSNKPFEYALHANYPNPFSLTTTIIYTLTSDADKVTVGIYTLAGRMIYRHVDEDGVTLGPNQYTWNGLDSDNNEVANGAYLYKITATKGNDTSEAIGKLIKMK